MPHTNENVEGEWQKTLVEAGLLGLEGPVEVKGAVRLAAVVVAVGAARPAIPCLFRS